MLKKPQNKRHGSKAGYSSGVAGVDARRATPPDPRPPRWGLAGCCQLDPSHSTLVTCAVGREGRHAPRPNDVGGPTTFPGRQNGGDPAASGDLRLGHRAPGRGGRRASIPLHALTTLLSALGASCLFEPRVARICPGNLRYICSDNGNASQGADNTSVRAGGVLSVGIPRFLNKSQHFTVHLFRPWRPGSARGSDGGPRRFTEVVPTPHAYSGQWPVKTKRATCSELRLGCHPETPVIEPCQTKPIVSGVNLWQIMT